MGYLGGISRFPPMIITLLKLIRVIRNTNRTIFTITLVILLVTIYLSFDNEKIQP